MNNIAEYVTHWKHRDTGENIELTFDIFDTPVTRSWIEVVNRRVNSGNVDVQNDTLHYSFPDFDNLAELHAELLQHVETAKQFVSHLSWPQTSDEVTQDRLNALHQEFHKAENRLHDEKISPEDNPEITTAFEQINFIIHSMEKIVYNVMTDSYKLINFGRNDISIRNPVTPEMRSYFYPIEVSNQKPARLYLGYATIGKNLQQCMKNDDPQVVRDHMLSPQTDIDTEAMFVYSKSDKAKSHDKTWVSGASLKNTSEMIEFMDKYDLYEHVNWLSPKHFYGFPPQLGVVNKRHDSMTDDDYYKIASQCDLVSVELHER